MRRAALIVAALSVLALSVLALSSPAVAAPGPPAAPEYWFDDWNVEQLWSDGARGQGVVIAEIDTGVNASLPELRKNVLSGKDFGSAGGDGRTDRSLADFGHGTAMASIMVAQPGFLDITGLAPDAKVLPVAIPLGGTSEASAGDHLADAIRWSADHGAKVISMSLGGSRSSASNQQACPVDEQDAIYHALSKGAVVFAAAGNQGSGAQIEEPAVCVGVVSIGAVGEDGSVADFSSRHRYLTMTAPGVNIPSLGRIPESAFAGDGTSQATALASAAAAVVWSKHPDLSGRELITRLLATLDRKRTSRDPAYGFGSLNLSRAVTASVPSDAPNPVYEVADAFVARDRAVSSLRLPPVAPLQFSSPPGEFAIGSAPSHGSGLFVTGLVLVGLGALVVIGLAASAVRRRRAASPGPEPSDDSAFAPPSDPAFAPPSDPPASAAADDDDETG